MNKENVEKLIDVVISVCRLEVDKQTIKKTLSYDDCDLKENLGFDSLLMVELVVEIEQTFNIEFDMNSLDINRLRYWGKLKDNIDEIIRV